MYSDYSSLSVRQKEFIILILFLVQEIRGRSSFYGLAVRLSGPGLKAA